MGDQAEIWVGRRKASAEKRSNNRRSSAGVLSSREIPFTSHNDGAHLVVMEQVDFWPGTGLWKARHQPHEGRGVKSLLQYIKERL